MEKHTTVEVPMGETFDIGRTMGHVFGPHSDLCPNCGCERPGMFYGGKGARPCPKDQRSPRGIAFERLLREIEPLTTAQIKQATDAVHLIKAGRKIISPAP
jgi:hypothetical protein